MRKEPEVLCTHQNTKEGQCSYMGLSKASQCSAVGATGSLLGRRIRFVVLVKGHGCGSTARWNIIRVNTS